MSELGLTWLAVGLFALVIVWGTDVPVSGRRPVLGSLIVVMVLFGLFAQTFYFAEQGGGLDRKIPAAEVMAMGESELRTAVGKLAMVPGELRGAVGRDFFKVVTSSLTHYGWLALALNLWFIFMFGYVLEGLIGKLRFGLIVLAGLLVPALMDGFLPRVWFVGQGDFVGGASGIVYAVFGAALVRFPRARVHVALNTSVQFWGLAAFLLVPITYITAMVDFSLTQLLLLIGMTVLFIIMQPVCGNLTVPVWGAVGYKLVLDVALVWPLTAGVVSSSGWRILGGLVVGGVMGVALCGVGGFKERWSELPARGGMRGGRRRLSLDELAAAAEDDAEAARSYLGQRVFIGDVARVLDFYGRVVMVKFPDMVLPPHEQLAVARLLQSKGRTVEALRAYENYLREYEVSGARWSTWMTAAELLMKVEPGRSGDARRYLRKFLEDDKIMMRDRVEAERLLGKLPWDDGEMGAGVAGEKEVGQRAGLMVRDAVELDGGAVLVEKDAGEDVMMPRLKPMSFEMVDGVVAQEQRRRARGERVDEGLAKVYWKLHPVRERPDEKEEALFPVKVKHSWDMQSELSGAYGVESGGESRVRPVPRGRMAGIEAGGGGRYAGAGGFVGTRGRFEGEKDVGVSGGREVDRHVDRDERMSQNYGGAADAMGGGERPRIRLAREARRSRAAEGGGGA